MRSRVGKTLLQLAAVLFFLNTATAYGACCLVSPEPESQVEMPCHQPEEGAGEELSGDCCLLCIPMIQADIGTQEVIIVHPADLIASITPPATSGVDPPFRPPIQLLS